MSPTYFVFGLSAVESRPIGSGVWRRQGWGRWCGVGGATGSLRPGRPHDPGDAFVVDRDTVLLAVLGGDPRGSAGAVRFLVHRSYPGGRLRVGRLPGGPVRGGPAPVVEARAADAEDAAEPLHATFFRRAAFSASSGAAAARVPASAVLGGRLTPAALTQFRRVSGLIPDVPLAVVLQQAPSALRSRIPHTSRVRTTTDPVTYAVTRRMKPVSTPGINLTEPPPLAQGLQPCRRG